ncbi:MAG: family 16 glycosylhydrolase, partial [Oscillospiraceae bacterium]|nr:family 16 glycosylhydrolase [Oscillospiraceae bacterium]
EYEEDYSGDDVKITNHEIDIEFPGRSGEGSSDYNFSSALCTTWIGENSGEYYTSYTDLGKDHADGEFHKYRFDWHTGDEEKGEEPRVEFYFDDVLMYTAHDFIPTNAGRLWLGLWFPRYWAGVPDFDTTVFEIDYIKIIPFHESGDKPQNESYPDDGWAEIPLVSGDVNLDGVFSIADIVMMQKRLTGTGKLKNWHAGDFNEDGMMNVFDLCLMKHRLINGNQ